MQQSQSLPENTLLTEHCQQEMIKDNLTKLCTGELLLRTSPNCDE